MYSPELQLLSVTNDDAPNLWLREPGGHAIVPAIRTEMVWFGGRPVAQVASPSSTLYTFTDHLGTPIVQTNTSAAIVWQAEYEPFGSIYEMRTGNRTDQPLRFRGQEVAMVLEGQDENYNVFRWYKAGWGRYTQGDPIGLRGGANLFAYARGNPARYADRLGLKALDLFEVPDVPPMPAPLPDIKCCSKGAIRDELNNVNYQINRMMKGGTPAGTVVAVTMMAYSCYKGECTPMAFDPSLFDFRNYKSDKCTNYCVNFHEWMHFSDSRTWGEDWSDVHKEVFHELPAYVGEKACLLNMLKGAENP